MKHAAVILAVILTIAAGSVIGQTRIRFARGSHSAVVTGNLRGYRDSRVFVVRVRAGQRLDTRQVGTIDPITIFVTGPDGEDAGDSDASCNSRRSIFPTAAGDYKIRVVECQKADPWRGRFTFRLVVR